MTVRDEINDPELTFKKQQHRLHDMESVQQEKMNIPPTFSKDKM